jgi:hypothetical protein
MRYLLITTVLGMAFAGPASAANILCKIVTNNHMNIDDSQVSACLDAGVGNLTGNPANDLFINGVGAGYEAAGKSDEPLNNPYNIQFTQSNGSGTWSFDASFWDDYGMGAIAFKFGTGNKPDEWFVYQLVDGVTSGNWQFVNVGGTGGGLSHINLYGIPGETGVPAPAPVTLLGVGLLGLGLVGRRRRRAA